MRNGLRIHKLFGALLLAMAVGTATAEPGGEAQERVNAPASGEEGGAALVEEPTGAGAEFGIDHLSLRPTAAGYMLDLRYRVVDPERAAPLFAKGEPLLVTERDGRQLAVPVPPKVGALRQRGAPEAGRSYFIFFANPGRGVQRGERVTLLLGQRRLASLTVE